MEEDLLIYQPNVINTYLHFIKENLILIKNIYNKKDPENLYSSRAKHIQMMTLLGLTTEHLIKLILLKRGFVLNTSNIGAEFHKDFMTELYLKKEKGLNQTELDELYTKSKENMEITFKKNLKSFDECLSLFKKSNLDKYYGGLGTYVLNPHPDVYDGDDYLGFKEIKPEETLKVIQQMRNTYLHRVEAQKEQQGVVWYLFNFLVWLAIKEYPEFFKDAEFIGSDDNKRLFQND